MKVPRFCLLFAVALSLLPAASLAQTSAPSDSSSSAFGVILLEGQNRPLRHARVEFFLADTGAAVASLTDDKGQFRFPELSAATYRITISAPGCDTLQFTASISGKVGPMVLRVRKSVSKPTPRNDSTVSLAELTMPDKAQRAFEKGTNLLLKGDNQASIPFFRQTIELAPGSYRPHHNLALALFHLGQFDSAEEEFQTSIDLSNGGFAPSLFGISMIFYRRGEFRQAESVIQNGILLDPASGVGRYCLALVQYSMGRIEESERNAREALTRTAVPADVHILLARIHDHLQNSDAVIADVQAYLKLDPHGSFQEDAKKLLERAQLNLARVAATSLN